MEAEKWQAFFWHLLTAGIYFVLLLLAVFALLLGLALLQSTV